MKTPIEIFVELGVRLSSFGDDARSGQTIAAACCANGWFSPEAIRRAVAAIAGQMLVREKLEAWLSHYPASAAVPRRVLVVMAGNIPLVGFFDLLCVVAAGHRCVVKPSAKDSVLMRSVVDVLRDIEPAIAVEFADENTSVDAVIATGGDNANRYFRSRYAAVATLLRGHRQSVAVLSGHESAVQLCALADDIWAYSGLGCRNVSLLFLPEGSELRLVMPEVNTRYFNNYRQRRALLTMCECPFTDLGGAVAVEGAAFPTALSELTICRYRTIAEVEQWLVLHDAELQCVVTECLHHSRGAAFGCAHSPELTDYPDEVDVMAFLAAL